MTFNIKMGPLAVLFIITYVPLLSFLITSFTWYSGIARGSEARDRGFDSRWELQNLLSQIIKRCWLYMTIKSRAIKIRKKFLLRSLILATCQSYGEKLFFPDSFRSYKHDSTIIDCCQIIGNTINLSLMSLG
jgi:hypothetical protein